MIKPLLLTTGLLALVLASCGTQPPVVAESTLTPQATDALNQTMLTLINQARSVGRTCGTTAYPAAPALKLSTQLNVAAQRHSQDMANKNFFSHTGSDGTSPFTRMTQAGYRWSAAAENISAGYTTAQAAVTGWLKSPGHCKNIMTARYKDLGVGYAYSASSTYKHYWTTDFATPY